jgi:hypothetical protein
VRSIDDLSLRVHLLCDLAGAFHASGEEKDARKLIKEARNLFDEEKDAQGLMASTALLRVYMEVENKTQTKNMFQISREFLEQESPSEWLTEQAFLQFLSLAQSLGRVQEVLPALNEPRKAENLADRERLGVLRAEIALGNFHKAEKHADVLKDVTLTCMARIDLALALLQEDPHRSLDHLKKVPLEGYRVEGIKRLALLNSSDIRPTEQSRVRDVLCQLTLLAAEHPDAMDSVLSRWIQACPDRETILSIADKMNWSTGAGPMFRQAMEALPVREAEDSSETSETEPPDSEDENSAEDEEPSDDDDGFQAVSLTQPIES